jgi:hypothetical protein
MARAPLLTVVLLLALATSGCTTLTDSRPVCRCGSAGVGFVAGGLIGGFAVNSLDLSSTKQGGATVGGVVGGGAVGAVIGAIVGNYACPDGGPPPPPAPAAAPAPAPTPEGAAPSAQPPE